MRIIAGLAKGRKLFTPKSHLIRPASDKVKGAVFNILGDISDLKVLDLFAGTGNVALEALSRGAAFATFVDYSREALELIKKNIALCKFEDQSRIISGPIPSILKKLRGSHFELAFVDPPYDKDLIKPALQGLLTHNLIDANSLVIVEHSPREEPACDGFLQTDQRVYGQTLISFLKKA